MHYTYLVGQYGYKTHSHPNYSSEVGDKCSKKKNNDTMMPND